MTTTLLLVDDDALAVEGEAFGLRQAGYRVLTARSLSEAARRIEADHPDVVLMDVNLPDGEGWAFGRRLHAAGVAFIFITARWDMHDVVHGLNVGAKDYIIKPVGLDELVARVTEVVRRAAPPAQPDHPVG